MGRRIALPGVHTSGKEVPQFKRNELMHARMANQIQVSCLYSLIPFDIVVFADTVQQQAALGVGQAIFRAIKEGDKERMA